MTSVATRPPLAGLRSIRGRPTVRPVLVRDFTDGQDVDQVLLVRDAEARCRARRRGVPASSSSATARARSPAMVWDGVRGAASSARRARRCASSGATSVHPRYGAQIAVRARAPAGAGHVRPRASCSTGRRAPAEQMERDLRELVATVQDPHLRRAARRASSAPGTPTWARYRRAPAAKVFHQAYRHGLLEHSLTVAQAVSAISATFPGIDRDVAVTGALLHDIGKLEAYTADPRAIDLTDARPAAGRDPARLLPRAARDRGPARLPARRLAQAVLHIILSHHGSLEHGRPVVPCTREATLVHIIDNLGGRLGSLRPAREGARRRAQQWSSLRPRDRRRRLLRLTAAARRVPPAAARRTRPSPGPEPASTARRSRLRGQRRRAAGASARDVSRSPTSIAGTRPSAPAGGPRKRDPRPPAQSSDTSDAQSSARSIADAPRRDLLHEARAPASGRPVQQQDRLRRESSHGPPDRWRRAAWSILAEQRRARASATLDQVEPGDVRRRRDAAPSCSDHGLRALRCDRTCGDARPARRATLRRLVAQNRRNERASRAMATRAPRMRP